jgi:S-adenosylmethionine:tRNA ribosyltransferase-isomerase
MRVDDFDYDLPPDRIATHPADRRDASRLLVLDRTTAGVRHRRFHDLLEELRPGDCLVVNDSRVIPARLLGRRAGGGRFEALLLAPVAPGRWRALVKPAKKLRPGDRIDLVGPPSAPAASLTIEADGADGERVVALHSSLPDDQLIETFGRMPLPPYILAARKARASAGAAPASYNDDSADRERYQTVYADPAGSVAAPTAGLHFTPDLIDALRDRGVDVQRVTLHVGPGTFAPVKADRVEDHVMHAEHYAIAPAAARAIEAARLDPARRLVAVGTTVTRTLEACVLRHGAVVPAEDSTGLHITPGFEFRAVDALITNFHLPRSTLLMLVAAFAGRDRVLAAYREAIREGYRFYSYGDAMLIS